MSVPPVPHRDEQTSAVPHLSPGPVRSHEFVLRTVLDPNHLDSNGKLANAISLDDIRTRGWSVDRTKYSSLWNIKRFHRSLLERKPDICGLFVLRVSVLDLRSLIDSKSNNQAFVVVDTAQLWRPGHADVLAFDSNTKESAARALRTALLQSLPDPIDAARGFHSTDRYGYARGLLKQCGAILRSCFQRMRRS